MDAFDLVIVGGGLAGLTAGLYGGRYGLKVAIVEQMAPGGQVLNVEKVETYPGFPQGVAGYDLGPMVQEQVEAVGGTFVMDTATGLQIEGDQRIVQCADTELQARAVIIAAGSSFRALGIPGEEEYVGRGVSHCASCDAPFFIGKTVCVVGGGDSAIDEAAVLAEQVGRVLVAHRGPSFTAQQVAQDALLGKSNVEPLFHTEVLQIQGDDTVTGVTLRDTRSGETRLEELNGVFLFVGLEPNTAFLQGVVDLDPAGHIRTDAWLQTSVPGVFAAGDIRHASSAQLVAAAGDGASAAVFAQRYLAGRLG